MGLKQLFWNLEKSKVYKKRIRKLNPARNPLRTKFEEQVRQAEKFKEETKQHAKPEAKTTVTEEKQKTGGVRYSKAKTIRGFIRDLKRGLYPPREVVVGLIKKVKTTGVRSLSREEGRLWNMLLKDENARSSLEKLWQEVKV